MATIVVVQLHVEHSVQTGKSAAGVWCQRYRVQRFDQAERAAGTVELKRRATGERLELPLDQALDKVAA